jgi:hypothetical protein
VKRRWLVGALVVTAGSVLAAHVLAALPIRKSAFSWDKNGYLRGTFSFRDAIDHPPVKKKLTDGIKVVVVMRGYAYPNAGGDPVALTAHTCRVAYDLWEEVYRVSVNGKKSVPVVSMKGVYRSCTDMVDQPIADRPTLKNKPSDYYLAVKVEVNPISEDALKKIQQWVTRPSGGTSIGPGDALFASFVGVFMKKVATADHVVEFQTDAFPQ